MTVGGADRQWPVAWSPVHTCQSIRITSCGQALAQELQLVQSSGRTRVAKSQIISRHWAGHAWRQSPQPTQASVSIAGSHLLAAAVDGFEAGWATLMGFVAPVPSKRLP